MKSTTVLGILVAGLALAVGCSAPSGGSGDSEKDDGLQQGLTVLEAQPGLSFSAAFKRGSEVVYLQAVRGRPTPQEYQQNPAFPKFEVDARIVDEDGRLIYLRRGGDDFVNPSWAKDLVAQDALPPPDRSNKALMVLVAEASASLEAELSKQFGDDLATQMLPEVDAIARFGREAPAAFSSDFGQVAARFKAEFPSAEVEYGTSGPEDDPKYNIPGGWYYISVHDMSIIAGFGRHSATRIHNWSGSAWATYYDFCNHGDCAGSMGQKCQLIGIEKPTWTALTCNTPYAWDSDGGGHNCHDDTRVQLAQFAYGPSMNRNQYWCDDGDSDTDISCNIPLVELDQDGSPECNASTNKGYNHPSMLTYSVSNTNSALQNTANFTVQLAKGATYTFSTCGTSSNDTYLRLANSDGAVVSSNDDACGVQSTVTYTAPAAGTYTIRGGCFLSGSCSAKVNVTLVSSPNPPSAAPPAPPASAVACQYYLGCPDYYMGAGDGCDCQADGSSCNDPDCG